MSVVAVVAAVAVFMSTTLRSKQAGSLPDI
jgi:hypothetical protein